MADDADVEMLDMPTTPQVNISNYAPISVPPIAARSIPVIGSPSASRPPLAASRSSSSSGGTAGPYAAALSAAGDGDIEQHSISGDEGEGSHSDENESASEEEEEGEGEGDEGEEGEGTGEGEGEGGDGEEAEDGEEGDEETDSEEEDDDDSVVEIPPPGQRERQPSAKPFTTPPAAVPVVSAASASDLPAPSATTESEMAVAGTNADAETTKSSSKPSSKAVKKKGRPRSPSPGTPPPPPAPPLQTIRLEIRLGGPENYEVDVRVLARETGQRPPSPAIPTIHLGKHYATDREREGDASAGDAGEGAGPPEGTKRKRKKKNHGSEYYDTNDPFIDDSELAIDDRHYFAQTKQQGFYVSSGEVALLKDKTPARKPKSKRSPAVEPAGGVNGTHAKADPSKENAVFSSLTMSATLVGSRQPGAPEGKRRKNYTVVEENGKKRKVVDIRDFKPELQAAFDDLKAVIANQSWENKSKFPPTLKPLLAEVALKAVHLGEYDEDFFNLMPVLFPYNRFTMSKLIKRLVFVDHVKILMDEQEKLLAQLGVLTKEGFPRAKEEWERAVIQWEKRQEKRTDGTPVVGSSGSEVKDEDMIDLPKDSNALSTASALDGSADDAGEGKEEGAGGVAGRDAHPPAQKYRLTEEMKQIIWQLVLLSNECCRLENEKNELEGTNQMVSEQGTRKVLYQKIVAAFPSGWLNSGQISRDVSAMKKKLEKEAMEAEG